MNISVSGTTAVMAYYDKQDLFVANVGDSRAVLGTRVLPTFQKTNESIVCNVKHYGKIVLEARELSKAHTLSVSEEVQRIKDMGGVVTNVDPNTQANESLLRVYKPQEDYPAIAMARSLGDSIASEIGVIHEPTVERFSYNPYEDEVLILASDGLWDVVSPNEAVNFVQKYRKKCAKQISRPPQGKYIRKKDTNIAHFLGEWAREKWII